MKKIILSAAAYLAVAITASAQFGVLKNSEMTTTKDEQTGVALTILTDTEKNDSFIYQTDPMWTPDGKWLLFRSSTRSNEPAIERTMTDGSKRSYTPTLYYFMEIATGKIVQVTDSSIGTVFLANTSNTLFLNKRGGNGEWMMYSMNLDKFFADAKKAKKNMQIDSYIKYIGTFPESPEMGRPGGWCVNSDDTYAYITVTREGTAAERAAMEAKAFVPRDDQPKKVGQSLSGLRKMDLRTGEVSYIRNVDFRVGHIQASRFRPEEIVFCCETGGDADQRMWYCNAITNEYKPLYKETPLDWVTHETFASEDYVYFNVLGWQDRLRKQVSGIFRINLRTDDVECMGQVEMDKDRSSSLTGRGFWHCNATRDNKWVTGDTFAGSVWVINAETGEKHWIASDTKMAPDHAHPFFSPDGTKLCFRSGHWSDGKRLNLVMVDLTKLPWYKK